MRNFGLECGPGSLRHYLRAERAFVRKAEAAGELVTLFLQGPNLGVSELGPPGYNAALAAGFLRSQLIESGQSFTFESVLSDKGKLTEMEKAKQHGYRIYLYFVCTEDPDIKVDRVANRVAKGGHPVAEENIRARYVRTLENLLPAFLLADRAYIFDNSGKKMELAVEADGSNLQMLVDRAPAWVMDHLVIPLLNAR